MKQILVIPNSGEMTEYLNLSKKYGVGFEFNEFFLPDVLDDEKKCQGIIQTYKQQELPAYLSVHGAFFDVIPFSVDKRIKEVSKLRIEQSISVAKSMGAKAVVFHTNYNPCLNSKAYVESWIKENAAYWAEVLAKHADIRIYLENMFDATPDVLETLSEQLCQYPNYGVCLDYAHACLSKTDPDIWAERLGRFVKHIHINDNDGVSDLHLAWGDGVADRKRFYQSYETYMKGATVLIETSTFENTWKSLKKLEDEGFLEE